MLFFGFDFGSVFIKSEEGLRISAFRQRQSFVPRRHHPRSYSKEIYTLERLDIQCKVKNCI